MPVGSVGFRALRQSDAFTGREHPDVHLRGEPGDSAGERAGWREGVGGPCGADGRQRSPVDGDRDPGLDEGHGARGALGIEVPGRDARPPPPNRQRGDVDPAGELVHLGKKIGVAGEVDAWWCLQQVPERGPLAARRVPAAVVKRRDGLDEDAAHRDAVARLDLDDLPDPPAAQNSAAPPRHDHWAVARHKAQGGRI